MGSTHKSLDARHFSIIRGDRNIGDWIIRGGVLLVGDGDKRGLRHGGYAAQHTQSPIYTAFTPKVEVTFRNLTKKHAYREDPPRFGLGYR